MHIEDSMGMYGIYNAETSDKPMDNVHHIHNITTQKEKLFVGELKTVYMWYVNKQGI